MSKQRIIIGLTEPSSFTDDCLNMIENFFKANPIKLCQNKEEDIYHWVDQCDAIILAGGSDIHPQVYGESVTSLSNFSGFDVKRDRREVLIIERCFANDIPILGICRGHQMLGVCSGLKMVQDLSESRMCHQPRFFKISSGPTEPMHWIQLRRAADASYELPSKCFATSPKQRHENQNRFLYVNSFHHQGVLEPEDKSNVISLGVALGLKKPIIELMKDKHDRWFSCQWHPEFDWKYNLSSLMVLKKFHGMIKRSLKRKLAATIVPNNPPAQAVMQCLDAKTATK